jgi:hypothetical protein
MCSRASPGLIALSIAVLLSAGCALSAPVPLARVQRGPGFDAPPRKILALPADCQAPGALCHPAQKEAMDVATRMILELEGYRLVDSEGVNVRTAERLERHHISSVGSRSHRVERESHPWLAASPAQRAAVAAEMGVDGALAPRITVGPAKNAEGQRTVEVRVTLTRADGALVWRSRCAVETGRFHDLDQAVERATRCALEATLVAGG